MIKNHPKIYNKKNIWKRESDGLRLYTTNGSDVLVLVPKEFREPLIIKQHHDLCHSGHNKVYNALKKHWNWPNMKHDVRKVVVDCAACQLLHAKRIRAHKHFRAKVFCTPRTSWGCDFYGIAESDKGYNNLLGAIDLATSETRASLLTYIWCGCRPGR